MALNGRHVTADSRLRHCALIDLCSSSNALLLLCLSNRLLGAFCAISAIYNSQRAVAGFCALDIVFVVDISGSIVKNQPPGVDNFRLMKSWVRLIVQSPSLRIGHRMDRVALVTFENVPRVVFDLESATTRAEVVAGIERIPDPYGETNTPAGINRALQVEASLRAIGPRGTGRRRLSRGLATPQGATRRSL